MYENKLMFFFLLLIDKFHILPIAKTWKVSNMSFMEWPPIDYDET